MNPPAEEIERDVDGSEEEREEHRHLHHGPGLLRPDSHRDSRRPQGPGEIDEQRKCVEPEQVDAAPADPHADGEGNNGDDRRGDQPAHSRCDRVAEHEADAIRRGEQEPARKSGLEVARDAEAREDAAERRRLQEHENELERGVTAGEREARDLPHLRQAARERGEVEQGERQ